MIQFGSNASLRGWLLGAVALTAAPALAATEVTEKEEHDLARWYNGNEMLGVKPQFGYNTYADSQGGRSSRFAYGIGLDYNLASAIGMDFTRWFVGLQSGATFSHLGNPDSNMLGDSPDTAQGNQGEGGANLLTIPGNVKLGYGLSPAIRVGAHGGANVIYRSIPSSIRLDEDNTASNWRMLPNAGADVDVSLGKNVGLSFRPDWTFSDNTLFQGTVALGLSLG